MGEALFPPCCLTWGQTMVEVMKIMATSFKMSHAHTAALSAPNPASGRRWPTPPPETPGHSLASLGQSLVEVTALFSWVLVHIRFSLCPQESCVSSGSSMVGLMVTSFKRAYAIPGLLHPEPLTLWQATANLYLHRKHWTQFWLSLCESLSPGMHKVCLSPPSVSGSYGVWF